MIQIVGALLVLGAAVYFSACFAERERYRLQELKELERASVALEGQISYLAMPLPELMESIGEKAQGALQGIFLETALLMRERTGGSAEGIWSDVWERRKAETFLTKQDLEAVLLFGKTLGCADREQQAGNILLFRRYLEEAAAQGKKRLEKNGRLYYSIGGLSGLLLIVMLL